MKRNILKISTRSKCEGDTQKSMRCWKRRISVISARTNVCNFWCIHAKTGYNKKNKKTRKQEIKKDMDYLFSGLDKFDHKLTAVVNYPENTSKCQRTENDLRHRYSTRTDLQFVRKKASVHFNWWNRAKTWRRKKVVRWLPIIILSHIRHQLLKVNWSNLLNMAHHDASCMMPTRQSI